VVTAVGHSEVVTLAEVERPARDEASRLDGRRQEDDELALDDSMVGVRCGNDVVRALPDLVVQIEAQLAALFDQRLELGRARSEHDGLHAASLTTGLETARLTT
jgi:hypothetical protein